MSTNENTLFEENLIEIFGEENVRNYINNFGLPERPEEIEIWLKESDEASWEKHLSSRGNF